MPTPDEWRKFVSDAPAPVVVTAHSYRGIRFGSFSAPVVLGCDDGEDYVVKAMTRPALCRAICNDQIVGRLANAMGAPVPPVALVDVPAVLIQNQPELATLPSGPAHGCRYIPGASDRDGIKFQDLSANRGRFANLAILYGLAGVFSDHQFFYEDGTNHVLSFDHGHFFPCGPDWTIQSLESCGPAIPDPTIVAGCNFDQAELKLAAMSLVALADWAVAMASKSPPVAWQLNLDERIALAMYLASRRDQLGAI